MAASAIQPIQSNHFGNFPDLEYSKLHYVTEMLGELRKLASDLDERTLNYLIEMAILEANQRLENVQYQKELII